MNQKPPSGERPSSLKTIQLAMQKEQVLDIPPRTRFVLAIAGLAGVTLIATESLISGQIENIETDKIVHFFGYGVLGLIFTLALRPKWMIPALLGLAVVGVGLEQIQAYFGRSSSWEDAAANAMGLGTGAVLGFTIRAVHSYLKTEIALADVRRRLIHCEPGELILQQGEYSERFFLIKEGMVEVTRERHGESRRLGVLGPGEVVGATALIRGTPPPISATAAGPVSLYAMTLTELMDAAGGKGQPVATVLRSFAERTAELVAELEKDSSLDSGERLQW